MKKPLIAALLALTSLSAAAEVTVTDPWVRATVPQQKATGAFMVLRADHDAKLVAARSEVAGVVEIHEMRMDGDVMKMNPIPSLALPANTDVALKPGGYHVMLLDLKRQMKDGDSVPLTLVVEQADGQRTEMNIAAPVRPLKPAMPAHRH